MSIFRPRGEARFVTAPAEVPIEDRIADIDRQLAEIAAVAPEDRTPHQWWQIDRLIDMRNAIRPAYERAQSPVPVIPGGAS